MDSTFEYDALAATISSELDNLLSVDEQTKQTDGKYLTAVAQIQSFIAESRRFATDPSSSRTDPGYEEWLNMYRDVRSTIAGLMGKSTTREALDEPSDRGEATLEPHCGERESDDTFDQDLELTLTIDLVDDLLDVTSKFIKQRAITALKDKCALPTEITSKVNCDRYWDDLSERFITHASTIDGPLVKLVREGEDSNSEDDLEKDRARFFLKQSHAAFQKDVSLMTRALNKDSASTDKHKSRLLSLSLSGQQVLEASLMRIDAWEMKSNSEETESKDKEIRMWKPEYHEMADNYEESLLGHAHEEEEREPML